MKRQWTVRFMEYLEPYDMERMDSIVLGCTHFVFYRASFGNLSVIISRLWMAMPVLQSMYRELLQNAGVCRNLPLPQVRYIYNSLNEESYSEAFRELLEDKVNPAVLELSLS